MMEGSPAEAFAHRQVAAAAVAFYCPRWFPPELAAWKIALGPPPGCCGEGDGCGRKTRYTVNWIGLKWLQRSELG